MTGNVARHSKQQRVQRSRDEKARCFSNCKSFVVKLTGTGFQRDGAGNETMSFSRPRATPGSEVKQNKKPADTHSILFCAGNPRQSESVVESKNTLLACLSHPVLCSQCGKQQMSWSTYTPNRKMHPAPSSQCRRKRLIPHLV